MKNVCGWSIVTVDGVDYGFRFRWTGIKRLPDGFNFLFFSVIW